MKLLEEIDDMLAAMEGTAHGMEAKEISKMRHKIHKQCKTGHLELVPRVFEFEKQVVGKSELRLGNIVDYFNEASDHWFNGRILSKNDLICLLDDRADTAEPIKLTKEWLLRLGFIVRQNIDDNYEELYEENLGYVVSLTKKGKYDFHFPSLYAGEITIKYVHQLQNIYFALTANELKLYGAE